MKSKKILLFTLTALTVLVLGVVSYLFNFVTSTSASIKEDIDRNPKVANRMENIDLGEGDPISILIMGLDTRAGEGGGRADAMVLVTINPADKSTHMVSIPRDTYMKISGAEDKINSTYEAGGTAMTVSSVEKLLDVPVDYFVKVNFKGFEGIVDALGGIKLNNVLEFDTYDSEFTDEKMYFPKGWNHLTGKEALIYARMRKQDPRGDFGRQERQRQVIEKVIEKGSRTSSILKFGEIATVIQNNVKTNMSLKDMGQIQLNYRDARNNIKQHKIEGSEETIKGTYYFMPDEDKLKELSNDLKVHLDLIESEPDESNEQADDNPEQNKEDSGKDKEESSEKKSDEQENPNKKDKENDPPQPEEDKATEPEEDTSTKETDENNEDGTTVQEDEPDTQQDQEDEPESQTDQEDTKDEPRQDSGKPNVSEVITKNWSVVPTQQENHTIITFEKGTLDWEEMTTAVAKGTGLANSDMILWWAEGQGTDRAIATVTNKAQTENYRVYVSWVDGAGYKPVKVEVLYENDQKNR
ncbi:cell envelope-related function transcriptional attenuator common domain-containing protein [Thalassobacillus cyri]|uniref:Cell envelope-related function transcriptional attenuator common domain-containing protein n=1 Tax=Thalassobacillus cyri TaxID=571932 RepID=A0A1H3WHV7_9BACI|nr:cell envelope-related function transcriptional attenuator common domain-containing protein [Thalassobacillus cyri]